MEKKIVFCASGRQVEGNESWKKKKEYLEYPHGTEWVERNHSDA